MHFQERRTGKVGSINVLYLRKPPTHFRRRSRSIFDPPNLPLSGIPAAGPAKWNYWKPWNFALEGTTSFSDVRLKISTYRGLLASGLALIYGLYFKIRTSLFGNPLASYPSLTLVVLVLSGIQPMCAPKAGTVWRGE